MKKNMWNLRFCLLTLAAVLVASGTFALGQWQVRRAAQKENLQAAIQAEKDLPALDERALTAIDNIVGAIYRPATLQGSWRAENTVFLDNRAMDGKGGFVVVTPLVLAGSSQVILVQRGWAPRSFTDRTLLPPVTTPAGIVSVTGRIAPPPSKLYEFKGHETGHIRQNLDLASFSAELGVPLMPVSLLQTGLSSEGLSRNWAAPNSGVEKHYGYAFQWFSLSALVVGLYIWFQLVAPFRAKKSSTQ